jgi:hypothetical protein
MFDQFDGPIGTSSGTINLVAGQTYPIRMEYCVSGLYGYAYLYWAYPGQTQQIIPSSALTPTAGTGMEGSYFNDNPGNFGSFGTFVSSEVDSNFYRWWNSPPQPGMNETWWSAQWRGQLLAPVTATYNFAVMADNGESLTINGQPLTNRWLNTVGTEYGSIQLTAGQLYNVQLNYANGTGPGGLYFEWAFPGQNLQPVPSKYLFTPMQSNLHGIEGVYYSDPNFATTALTRTDSGINFNWASTPPASSMPSSNYSVLWSGQLLAQQSASTYFLVKAVGKVILTVDGQVLLNNNSSTPWSIQTRGLILAAGQRYDIKVQYQPGTSPGSIQLLWRCQGQSTATIIPSSALFLNYDLTP